MKYQKAVLVDWSVLNTGWFGRRLTGTVYNHPRIPDGKLIYTAPLKQLFRTHHVAFTLNTRYVLAGKEREQ
jgi:hypothetical protein